MRSASLKGSLYRTWTEVDLARDFSLNDLRLTQYGQIAWSGLFQITLAFISLYNLLGWTMFVGVAVMIATMPVTAFIARYQTKLQRQQMKNKDQRTSIMSEILNNIRSIKLYAWENSFAARLFDVRNNKELVMLRKMVRFVDLCAHWTRTLTLFYSFFDRVTSIRLPDSCGRFRLS
jgi:ABC-type bacteriocin/lantibiotic exporter with double-glycine peptidase domain